jgi:hypothetical protein
MLLNKVLFVSLLVLGLCFLQPAFGERLATRIAGGNTATTGQFPFVVVFTYPYTDASGNTFTYQGTGVIYNNNIVVTTASAIRNCNGLITITQGSTNTFAPEQTAQTVQFTCVQGADGAAGVNVVLATGNVAGQYFLDMAKIILPLPFTGAVSLRLPTSSPTQADVGSLYAVGWGESVPGAQPSPQLLWVPLNPQRTRVCIDRATTAGILSSISFAENFCVAGFVQNANNVTSDACVLDAGAPIIRTQNINAPYADHEVVGLVNFGSCTASSPVIATYLWKYIDSFLGAQTAPPTAGSPVNPRSADGNFACGDGIVTPGLEKCDVGSPTVAADPFFCCNPYTCQFVQAGTACTVNNNNGTRCLAQPRCNNRGICVTKFKNHFKTCNGPKTRCQRGKCCTYPGAINCF